MAITQHVKPRTNVLDGPGWCLRHTQSVYGLTGAPFWHESAWKAWLATEHKHKSRTMPNASVPVWFSHFGTYGAPARYDNWGHVVSYVPGRGFLSSPAWVRPGQTVGQQWFDSIEAVERTFNAKFVGWSEDLNGTRIISGVGGAGSGSTGGLSMADIDNIMKELKDLKKITRETRSEARENKKSIDGKFTIVANIGRWIKTRMGGSIHGKSITNLLGDITTSDISAEEFADAVIEQMGEGQAEAVVNALGKRLSEK